LVRASTQTRVAHDIVGATDNVRNHSKGSPTRYVTNNQTKQCGLRIGDRHQIGELRFVINVVICVKLNSLEQRS
jgi:hypothetical protein